MILNGMKWNLAGTKMVDFTIRLLTSLELFRCVHSDTSIKINRDFSLPIQDFKVYWNVPTYVCKKYGYNFKDYHQKFGIISNDNDDFRGDNINILYDPGMFPAVLEDNQGHYTERNGGIPQLGNITQHLMAFKDVLESAVSANLEGLGIIDFEIWRPNFRQNWNSQVVYKNMSLDLERQYHPQWTEKEIRTRAEQHFEKAAKIFMDQTLRLAKLIRPKAVWGYYGFPYCYNFRISHNPTCPPLVVKENNQINWLFDDSTALYPSIYMSSKLNESDQEKFIIGRLNEAWRVSTYTRRKRLPLLYPYVWYKYHDNDEYMTEADMYASFEIPRQYKAGGVIIWGASVDVNTKDKCKKLLDYLNDVMGPALLKARSNENKVTQPSSILSVVLRPFRPKSADEDEDNVLATYQTAQNSSQSKRSAITEWHPVQVSSDQVVGMRLGNDKENHDKVFVHYPGAA